MPKFSVGDFVSIVPEPNYDCAFGWIDNMDRFCGQIAKVVHAGYSCNHNCDRYSIDADGGRYNWDEGCFQESVPSIEEEELTQPLFSKEVIP